MNLAFPEHRSMTRDDLDHVDRELGTWGRLITLDGSGEPMDWRQTEPAEEPLPVEQRVTSYSEQRRWMADHSQGRVLVGGQLRGFQGAQPGLVEEAALAVERGQPLYLAGGFGGASAAVSRRLDPGSLDWLPPGLPEGEEDLPVHEALDRLQRIAEENAWAISENGLSEDQRSLMAASHRPGEIASLSVVGLAAKFSTDDQGHT